MNELDQLNNKFSIPGVAKIEPGAGGLERISVTSSLAEAHIYLHGAHVTHFAARGQKPLLFLSEKSHFSADKPIRGGVPICFPWFGPKAGDTAAPMHGFARLLSWDIAAISAQPDGTISVELQLQSSERTRALWPFDFQATYQVNVGKSLGLKLRVTNQSTQKLSFEEALHTYLSVGDVKSVAIDGLAGRTFIDKVDGAKEKTQSGQITIAGETDRVYLDTSDVVTVNDPALTRKLIIHKGSSSSTVVWNPWIAKAKAMADFGDDEWPGMLCIETANAARNIVNLAPGATQEMWAAIEVSRN